MELHHDAALERQHFADDHVPASLLLGGIDPVVSADLRRRATPSANLRSVQAHYRLGQVDDFVIAIGRHASLGPAASVGCDM